MDFPCTIVEDDKNPNAEQSPNSGTIFVKEIPSTNDTLEQASLKEEETTDFHTAEWGYISEEENYAKGAPEFPHKAEPEDGYEKPPQHSALATSTNYLNNTSYTYRNCINGVSSRNAFYESDSSEDSDESSEETDESTHESDDENTSTSEGSLKDSPIRAKDSPKLPEGSPLFPKDFPKAAKHLKDSQRQPKDSPRRLPDVTYICAYCHFKTKHPSSLPRHIKLMHYSDRPFSCGHCGYSTGLKSTLRNHILCRHSIDKPLKCPQCKFKCAIKRQLNSHISFSHSPVQMFVCPFEKHPKKSCHFKSRHIFSLKRHLVTKHSLKGSLPQDNSDKTDFVHGPWKSFDFKTIEVMPTKECVESRNSLSKNQKDSVPKRRLSSNVQKHFCPHEIAPGTPCGFKSKYISSVKKHAMTKHAEILNVKRITTTSQVERLPETPQHSQAVPHENNVESKNLTEVGLNCNSSADTEVKILFCPFEGLPGKQCTFKTTHMASLRRHATIKHASVGLKDTEEDFPTKKNI